MLTGNVPHKLIKRTSARERAELSLVVVVGCVLPCRPRRGDRRRPERIKGVSMSCTKCGNKREGGQIQKGHG